MEKTLYNKEREIFFNELGWEIDAIKDLWEEGEDIESIVKIREKDIQRQVMDSKIEEAKYNDRYKKMRVEIGNLGIY